MPINFNQPPSQTRSTITQPRSLSFSKLPIFQTTHSSFPLPRKLSSPPPPRNRSSNPIILETSRNSILIGVLVFPGPLYYSKPWQPRSVRWPKSQRASAREVNVLEKCLCLPRNISEVIPSTRVPIYLFGDQEDGRGGFLTLLSSREGRFPALQRARNRSMGSPWRQTSPYLYSPRCFPMKLRRAFIPVPQASYPTFVRSTLIEGRRIELGRIYPPEDPPRKRSGFSSSAPLRPPWCWPSARLPMLTAGHDQNRLFLLGHCAKLQFCCVERLGIRWTRLQAAFAEFYFDSC